MPPSKRKRSVRSLSTSVIVMATPRFRKASSRRRLVRMSHSKVSQVKIVLSGRNETRVPVWVEVPISWSSVTGTPRSKRWW